MILDFLTLHQTQYSLALITKRKFVYETGTICLELFILVMIYIKLYIYTLKQATKNDLTIQYVLNFYVANYSFKEPLKDETFTISNAHCHGSKREPSPFTTCHILTEQTICILSKHTYRFRGIFQLVSKDSYKDLLQDFCL